MPTWLVVFAIIAAYAMVTGVTYRTLHTLGKSSCHYGSNCDMYEGHRWMELLSALFWFIGIPMYVGLWIGQWTRLGQSKEVREAEKHRQALDATRCRTELANAEKTAREAEAAAREAATAALVADIEQTNAQLKLLKPELKSVTTDGLR